MAKLTLSNMLSTKDRLHNDHLDPHPPRARRPPVAVCGGMGLLEGVKMDSNFINYLLGLRLGLVCALGVAVMSWEPGVAPIELSTTEYAAGAEMVQPLVPMRIKLTVLPDLEFDAVRQNPQAEGFTRLGDSGRQCEIVLPVRTGSIHFIPGANYSPHFDPHFGISNWGEMTLTHEILHCMRGQWHK